MSRYVIKRLLYTVVIVLAAAFVGFTLMYLCPGDAAELSLGVGASESVLAAKRAELGTDRPYLVQLGTYLYNTFLRLDFGTSWKYGNGVGAELLIRLPRTLIMGLGGMILNVTIGTWMGIFAATHAGKWQDSVTLVIAMFFTAAPGFWVALMMIVLFCNNLGLLPSHGIDAGWRSYILPIVCSSLGGIAINARQARSAMLEVIHSDFVTTARSKGQKERKITYSHILPNAMMPIITGVGGGLAMVVAGSPVMEQVFSIPGIGMYMLDGVNSRDIPIVCGCVVFFAVFTSLAMLVMDLCYAFLDPRIKGQYAKKKV